MSEESRSREELLQDVNTLRKQLRRQRVDAWAQQAVAESPNPIFMVDRSGAVTAWNPATEQLVAGSGSLRRRDAAGFIRRADGGALDDLIGEVWCGNRIDGVALILKTSDGAERIMQSRLYPVFEEDSTSVLGCVFANTDVTERAHHEQELIAAKEAAEAAARVKSTILNNLSHEIRTPLTAILGFAELLYEEVSDPNREFVQLIRSSGKRLMGTLIAVLELARLEAGDVRLNCEVLDLCGELRDAVRMFGPMAEDKGLRLELDCPERSLRVRLDRVALGRILSNLLSNAVKFTPDGSIRVEGGVEEDVCFVRVVDTGLGISDAFLPYVFDEFKQESEGLSRRHEGAGLGLAITKRLVEQMGGTIEVASEHGTGTTFTVRFPREQDAR